MEKKEQKPLEPQPLVANETAKPYSYGTYGKRPLWQWILLYVVVGGIIYAGIYYFFLRNAGYNYSTSQYQQSADQSNTNADNLKKDTTVNQHITGIQGWKTYTSTTDGYTIQYPSVWYLKEPTDASSPVAFTLSNKNGETTGVTIIMHENPTKSSVKGWWEQRSKEYGNYTDLLSKTVREEKRINGYAVYFVQTGPAWQSRPFTSTFIAQGTRIYEITTDFTTGDNYVLYSQMLPTFKLSDPSQSRDTSMWKTFSSSRCSISTKYPEGFTAEETELIAGTNNPNYNYGCISIMSPGFKNRLGVDSYDGLLISVARTTVGTIIASKTINSVTDYINLQNGTPPVINQSKKTYTNGVWNYYEVQGYYDFSNLVMRKGNYIYKISWAKDHEASYGNNIDPIVNSLQL